MVDKELALARASTAQACQGDSSMPVGQFTNSEVMKQLRQVRAEIKACRGELAEAEESAQDCRNRLSAKLDRAVELIDQWAGIPAEDGDESAMATQASVEGSASQASEHLADLARNEGFANRTSQIEKCMAKEISKTKWSPSKKTINSPRKRVHVSDELEKDAEYELSNKRQKPNDEDINNQAGPSGIRKNHSTQFATSYFQNKSESSASEDEADDDGPRAPQSRQSEIPERKRVSDDDDDNDDLERRQPGAAQMAEASCSAASDDKKSSPPKSPTKRPTIAVEYTSLAELEKIKKSAHHGMYREVVGKIKSTPDESWDSEGKRPFKFLIECSEKTIEVIAWKPIAKHYHGHRAKFQVRKDIRINSAKVLPMTYPKNTAIFQLQIEECTSMFIRRRTGTEIPIPIYRGNNNTKKKKCAK